MRTNHLYNLYSRQWLRQWCQKRLFWTLLLVHSLMPITEPTYAEMYKWVDKHGQTHYTDTKPKDKQTLEIKGTVSSYSAPQISNLPNDFFTYNKKSGHKKVVMYSAQWCGVCKRAKKYFIKNKIPHTEYDIDKSKKAKREFDRLNGRGVPIILVGRKRMNGFSVAKFKKLYEDN